VSSTLKAESLYSDEYSFTIMITDYTVKCATITYIYKGGRLRICLIRSS